MACECDTDRTDSGAVAAVIGQISLIEAPDGDEKRSCMGKILAECGQGGIRRLIKKVVPLAGSKYNSR